jgi:hypothetical protein
MLKVMRRRPLSALGPHQTTECTQAQQNLAAEIEPYGKKQQTKNRQRFVDSLKLLKMEALGRVELPTNGLGNRCSIHLSYRAARGGDSFKFNA